MAAGNRSEDGALAAVAALRPAERLAAAGALVCFGSLFLPWYRTPFGVDLVRTGWSVFGWAEAALLLTLAATLTLLFAAARGLRPALPLHEGTLIAAAGVWSSLIVCYLMLDRPDFRLAGFEQDYGIAYGMFVALGGALTLTVAGLRVRSGPRSARTLLRRDP